MASDPDPDLRLVLRELGGPDKLRLERGPAPEPSRDEVRIRVRTAGLSPADLLLMWGLHPERRRPPFTPGWDVIGTVDGLGADARGVEIGERVAAMTIVGGLARYVCVPAAHVVPVPEGLDPAEAQCIPFDYTVAYQMIHRVAHPPAGARVLVQGAAGSTGSALVSLGRGIGWHATYGTVSSRDLHRVREAGAIPIDYRHWDFRRVIAQREPAGLDAVFDGLGHTLLRSFRCLRPGGTLVAYGHAPVVAGGRRRWALLSRTALQLGAVFGGALLSHRRARLYSIQDMRRRQPDWYRTDVARLFAMLASGELHPRVSDRVPLERAPDALARIARGEARGKIVVEISAA